MAVSLLVYLAEKLANYIEGVQENLGSYTKTLCSKYGNYFSTKDLHLDPSYVDSTVIYCLLKYL